MKKIKIIELGGTISAHGKNRLDFKDYVSGHYKGTDFLQAVPELAKVADVTFDHYLTVTSTAIETEHWIQIREKVIHTLEVEGYDGVVITHGTNTIEETAYFLHLTVPSTKPVIITGSQKPFTAISSDAHINLLQAVRVAASEEAVGKGVLVVLNESISSAREVTKTNTYRLETFQSGQFGFLGFVDADHNVVFYRESTKRHTATSVFSGIAISGLPEVEIVYSYAGARGNVIRGIAADASTKGIVTAGTGAGLVSPKEHEALQEAAEKGLYIVRSNRGGNGRVLPVERYADDPFITADNLLPQKARILLMLGLLQYDTKEDLQSLFDIY
jgi:L-asparaginase